MFIQYRNRDSELCDPIDKDGRSNPFCDKTVMEMGNPKKGILSGNISGKSKYVRSYDKLSYTTYQDTACCVL